MAPVADGWSVSRWASPRWSAAGPWAYGRAEGLRRHVGGCESGQGGRNHGSSLTALRESVQSRDVQPPHRAATPSSLGQLRRRVPFCSVLGAPRGAN